ncbi:unnamed protein product [Ectocarpus sp. CCAP 1310/34]|nr:unnamed protein product [Ectocarpus sp. CCAP 1310/34]
MIYGGALPKSLRCSMFGRNYNQRIDGNVLPTSMVLLDLGGAFNEPIQNVSWPPSLERLRPVSLEKLALGESSNGTFDEPIHSATRPMSLQHLRLSGKFNQPIVEVVWLQSSKTLTLDGIFNQPFHQVIRPSSLRQLKFGHSFNQPKSSGRPR